MALTRCCPQDSGLLCVFIFEQDIVKPIKGEGWAATKGKKDLVIDTSSFTHGFFSFCFTVFRSLGFILHLLLSFHFIFFTCHICSQFLTWPSMPSVLCPLPITLALVQWSFPWWSGLHSDPFPPFPGAVPLLPHLYQLRSSSF